ncbi:ferritin [Microbacterium sp. X-17]|uniref:ferritin n=1 Tax=Microbacterium sp. X-17 TaxID=3144404 RepID=UPI0031F55116
MPTFDTLLSEQIGHEFAASQQYIAIAVWFDDHDLPQLAGYFYRQSREERNHAMMLVRYRLDRGMRVVIPAIPAVVNDFENVREAIALALAQEKTVSEQIQVLFGAARTESDGLGEQAMLWFLREQVEEIASMQTLLNVAERTDNLFDIENFVARETSAASAPSPDAPAAAGGVV